MQRVGDRANHRWLQNSRPSELSDLLCRFTDRQVARTALAVLYFASCGQSESLLGRLVSFLFGHWVTAALRAHFQWIFERNEPLLDTNQRRFRTPRQTNVSDISMVTPIRSHRKTIRSGWKSLASSVKTSKRKSQKLTAPNLTCCSPLGFPAFWSQSQRVSRLFWRKPTPRFETRFPLQAGGSGDRDRNGAAFGVAQSEKTCQQDGAWKPWARRRVPAAPRGSLGAKPTRR